MIHLLASDLTEKISDLLTKMYFNRRTQLQARIREEQCLVNMRKLPSD